MWEQCLIADGTLQTTPHLPHMPIVLGFICFTTVDLFIFFFVTNHVRAYHQMRRWRIRTLLWSRRKCLIMVFTTRCVNITIVLLLLPEIGTRWKCNKCVLVYYINIIINNHKAKNTYIESFRGYVIRIHFVLGTFYWRMTFKITYTLRHSA